MAHPVKNVSNQAVLDALKIRFGLQFPPEFSLSGAQNSTFARRVFDHLRNSGQQYPGDVFSTAVTTAKDLELINQKPDWPAEEKLLRTLKAYGVPEDQVSRIYDEAKRQPTAGIRQAGKEISTQAWAVASRKILGDTPFVIEAERRAGLAPPPPVAGQPAPAPPPPPAPAPAPPPPPAPQQPAPKPAGPSPQQPAQRPAGTQTTTAPASPGLRNLPSLPTNAPPEQVEAYIRKHYGYHAWILDIPELRSRMIELGRQFAGAPEISDAAVEGALMDTQWWKTHEADQRLAIEEKATDPATYNAKVEGKFRSLASLAGQIGFAPNEARLRQMAITAYDGGWNEVEMRAALAAEFDYNPEIGQEAQSVIVGDLRRIASDYLVPLGEQTIDQWGRQIIAGTATNETFTEYAKNMAKSMFGHYAADIDAGRTVKQIADPFVQMAARDLELTSDQINLEDAKWRRALEVDPDTGQPMQLSKWQRTIRSDSSYGWDSTQGARAEAAEFARKIAESFGRA